MRAVDLDPKSLATIVREYNDELVRLKNLQRIGSDGIQLFRVNTGLINIDTDPANPSSFLKMFRIKFTPDDNVEKSGLSFQMIAAQQFTFNNVTSLSNQSSSFRRMPVTNGNIQIWDPIIQLLSNGTQTNLMKFYCFATSNGTISIEYL